MISEIKHSLSLVYQSGYFQREERFILELLIEKE